MKKTPNILVAIRETLLRLIPPELLDEHCVWIHWSQHEALRAKLSFRFESVTHAEKIRLLDVASCLLTALSVNPLCRTERWRNTSYCPGSPYGRYWWGFHVEMVQELLWLYPEFIVGYRFGRKPVEPYRDTNPYHEHARERSWDRGYILGLANPIKVRSWLKERATKPATEDPQ